ncbi:TetR/AcrR family transcriptional regulator [Plantactinospora sp. WMMC1484]|uniref:TetR/AcrR family transcriptional regulator n=1 Tax=Plantactinospora sp. WMMC1484 TaxID=3404122 RepID=UPI003BF5968D
MSDAPSAPFHVGLTRKRIVDVALELTHGSHLAGWSIRDLARRLDVAPSVIYHHVGGKDLIARHVAERVLDGLAAPPADLDWQDWFRALLDDCYQPVSAHPGVAKWVLMHGPTFPSVLPIVDTGVQVLLRAGFGDQAGFAYAALLNNAMLTISIGDDRLLHEDDGPRDHATMMDDFRRATDGSPGVSALAEAFITPFAQGGQTAARQRRTYYTFVVQTTIAGLATLLGEP